MNVCFWGLTFTKGRNFKWRAIIILLAICMTTVYLLLGSNENNRQHNLEQALKLMALKGCEILNLSGLYETEAWGLKEQQAFINQAAEVRTALPPLQLLSTLKSIEKEVGRVETVKWGPRVIDIDILFYGTAIINEPELKVPHPFLHQRRFTLAPLNEIASQLVHPVLNKTLEQLLAECEDTSEVKAI